MCYIERHTCICDHGDHPKLMLKREVICPPTQQCSFRGSPAGRPIFRCEDFHRGPEPILRYKCAICRTDDIAENLDVSDQIDYSENPPSYKQQRTFKLMDPDYLTEFQHLAKTRRSGRRYFVQADYRDAWVDEKDEYAAQVWQTGKVYWGEPGGQLVPTSNGKGREVHHYGDPSPMLYDLIGLRDYKAEGAQACAEELGRDERYELWDDPEGGPTAS